MTKYEKDKISEIYGGAISDIYEYVLEKRETPLRCWNTESGRYKNAI